MWAGKLLAALLTALFASGAIPTTGTVSQVAAIAAVVLGYLGFAVVRTQATTAAMKSPGIAPGLLSGASRGSAKLQLIAVLALVGLVFSAACLSSSQAKTGGTTAGACAISDLVKFGADVKAALAKEGFFQALKDVAKQDGLAEESVICLVQGVLAVEGSGLATSEPTPITLHARAYLAAHGVPL